MSNIQISIKGGVSMFSCVPVEKTSKNGQPYIALEITFPNGYKKLVFLDRAEEYLASLSCN